MAISEIVAQIFTCRPVLGVTSWLLRAGALCQGPGAAPQVALTFDDGPHATWTPRLLDCLQALNIKATFFVVGQSVARHPEIVLEAQRRGHEIGTHLYDHRSPKCLTPGELRLQMERSLGELTEVLGQPVRWLRFPYGDPGNWAARKLRHAYGVTPVYWTISSLDSRARDATAIVRRVEIGLRPGAIVLLHDCLFDADRGLPSRYNPDRNALLAAMPKLGDLLVQRKLRAVTLSDLLGGAAVATLAS